MAMESEGMSSGPRGSAGGVGRRSERSSSSTQGVFLPKGVEDRDGLAPKCHCGVYAVLYMSKTANNPNRLFCGCPFFMKARLPHCKFFCWLDRHTKQLEKIGNVKCAEDNEDVDQHLEERVTSMEMRNKLNL
ncbi:hypothetical protein PIB30_051507, partial [Stylosanthes scabra]|nr:hypothetical protein [Stylosanthes scabra]